MSDSPQDPWLELLCSEEGNVVEVVHSDADRVPAPGGSLCDLVDPGSADKIRKFVSQVAARGEAYGWELNLRHEGTLASFHFAGRRNDRGLRVVAARSRRRLLALLEGRVDGVGAGRDAAAARAMDDDYLYDELTRMNNEMANLHRQVAKQASELERLNRRKNQLLGMAAHDLRNPVATIHAYSDLLENDLSSTLAPEQLDFLTTIKSTSQFLLELINDLLDLATIEAGELRLRLENVDVVALVRNHVDRIRVLARRKRLNVRFASEIDSAVVEVDARKLQQVVDNLLGNAIKFSPPGGVVDVRTSRQGGCVVVSVIDEGAGVSSEEKDRLFDPFHRGRREHTEDHSGTGLGLAICRRIVEGHGGRIWVDNEPGRGAVFSFSIGEPPALAPT